MAAFIQAFFHPASCTWSYGVSGPATRRAAVIDPVLDYEPAGGRTGTASAEAMLVWLETEQLALDWILETHAHADHLSAAPFIKARAGGQIGIGAGICAVQTTFKRLFNLDDGFQPDGSQFDRLFADGEVFSIGSLDVHVLATPGHTSDSVSYRIDDAVFVGDTLFMPDCGTARCDFPGGSAGVLYDSIQKLLALPAQTRLYLCHDYAPGGREYRHVTTVAEQRAGNIYVKESVSRVAFIARREQRDKTLTMPRLLLPAVQVNIRAGELPEPEANGIRYLKIPLDWQ